MTNEEFKGTVLTKLQSIESGVADLKNENIRQWDAIDINTKATSSIKYVWSLMCINLAGLVGFFFKR
jgi:hypothetical protein